MPELLFKGKEFVYNHHLTVPFRPLVPQPKKSYGNDPENLIIQGDNLHALKSLLPRYAGKVDLVFIDPPYNTGNEGWCYNDNVNSPFLKEWLSGNPVNKEDMLRHDKWMCMMWPRMKLLHELLSENGSIWITLDDNEVGHARLALDEIFGESSFVGQIVWQKRTSRENRAVLSPSFDHVLVYARELADTWKLFRNLLDDEDEVLSNPDKDKRGPWKSIPFSAQGYRENQVYVIQTPTGKRLEPPRGRCWGATEPEFEKLKKQKRIYWPKGGDGRPRVKMFPGPDDGLVPNTLWLASEVGDTERSKKQLMQIFSERETLEIHAPKPTALVRRIIQIATDSESIVLDSFAGSGTTAHAVLEQNGKDAGNRKFILVECEGYADTLTAERVRRVIKGYDFTGIQRDELMRESITMTKLKKANLLLDRVVLLEQQNADRFDRIKEIVKDGDLIVTGERDVVEHTEGLGGGFTYCKLGDKLEIDDLLTGKSLPSLEAFGSYLFHTATGRPLDPAKIRKKDGYLGESAQYHVWLVYKPDLDFLKSGDAALTLSLAEKIAATDRKKTHLVFAPARFVPQKKLLELGVEHAPLPYALYRIEKA